MTKRTALFLLGSLVLGASAHAADAYPGRFHRFERLTPLAGQSSVAGFSSICQDRDGFLWAGTSAGLARYDGYRFTLMTPSSGPVPAPPPPVGIYPVTVARSGDIWVGTSGQGLFRFSRETGAFTQFRHDARDPGSLGDDIVLAVQEDAEGDLWVGTRRRGLDRFDRKKGTFTRVPLGPGSDVVWDVLVDRKGLVWAGTLQAGLFRIDPRTGKTDNFRCAADDARTLGADAVWTVFEDRAGTIWAGTKGGGLNRYDPGTNGFVRFYGAGDLPRDLASQTITAIAEDRSGRLWLGTLSEGLRIWDRAAGSYVVCRHDPRDPESLGDDNVTSILEDSGGVVWVGTVRGGLNKCLSGLAKFEHYKHSPTDPRSIADDNVRALWADASGTLWVGTGSGLEGHEPGTGRVRRFPGSAFGEKGRDENPVLAVLGDSRGGIWLGTGSSGLVRFDPGTGKFVRRGADPGNPNALSNNKVTALCADAGGPQVLWVGTHQGLNRYDTRTNRWSRFLHDPRDPGSLSGNSITAIHGDSAGSLWVGTRTGLNMLDRATGKCSRFVARLDDPPGTTINDNIVHCIQEARDGVLWVGTDGGLNRFDRATGLWRAFARKDGLAGDIVCGIREDASGLLWVATNRGLSTFEPKSETFRNYGVHDGLQGPSFNPGASFRADDGRLFFGGTNGLNTFEPADVRDDAFAPPVVWTAFRRNNREAGLGGPLSSLRNMTLPYHSPLVTFEFAAMSFAAPELNTLVYRLEPRDRDWVPLDPGNTASLSGLGAGEYALRVRAANPDGVWNEEGIAIAVTVPPPFWRTWWFALIAAAFLATGAFSVAAIMKKIRSSSLAVGENLDGVIEAYDLTAREREILRMVLQGANNKDIERKLFISGSTVRNHITNIYRKLDVRNRLELINRVARDGRANP
jgi:ligand-binding sensor domain-containing protein/DNA-binding CsgD family transcriptional regulator